MQPGLFTYTRKCPIGVVGHIVPWNYPVLEMVKMIAPCIAAGWLHLGLQDQRMVPIPHDSPEPHPHTLECYESAPGAKVALCR